MVCTKNTVNTLRRRQGSALSLHIKMMRHKNPTIKPTAVQTRLIASLPSKTTNKKSEHDYGILGFSRLWQIILYRQKNRNNLHHCKLAALHHASFYKRIVYVIGDGCLGQTPTGCQVKSRVGYAKKALDYNVGA